MSPHGYDEGSKYRGGDRERKSKDGPGKNAQHKDGGHHSQKPKGNRPTKGDPRKR